MSIWNKERVNLKYNPDDWILSKGENLPKPKKEIIEAIPGPVKPSRMALISFHCPHQFINALNQKVRVGLFSSRSEAIRYSIQYYLQTTENTD